MPNVEVAKQDNSLTLALTLASLTLGDISGPLDGMLRVVGLAEAFNELEFTPTAREGKVIPPSNYSIAA